MAEAARIAMYADLFCPYAYISAYRVRKLRSSEYPNSICIEHKSLSLEYINKEPTPRRLLASEIPLLMLEEPDIPYQPWYRSESEWPVTMWPAFEAVKCAERQSLVLADELDWAIRKAFFAESRCISLRHVLFELAEETGVDMARFSEDFDHGAARYQVLQETKDGWEHLHVAGSPTFVLASGKQYSNLSLPEIEIDEKQHYRVLAVKPAPCKGELCLDLLRQMFQEAIRAPRNQ
ncbi:dithiol-disulfide isomerase [Ktedonosporobacter rubrisoli]|uniref:Dithiol-disulfide isomerase n=1 Tax=Ktedonosporobacter rubrisoli TaxID=2509675 RepID=A0A4P6JIS8_KTERU|nr:DsbA family protein [Ktedonosporobacter rubrisoli]QBD74985.1 dithiol-disulfide isomerase [Ktedonosporobacter rubrisoli]